MNNAFCSFLKTFTYHRHRLSNLCQMLVTWYWTQHVSLTLRGFHNIKDNAILPQKIIIVVGKLRPQSNCDKLLTKVGLLPVFFLWLIYGEQDKENWTGIYWRLSERLVMFIGSCYQAVEVSEEVSLSAHTFLLISTEAPHMFCPTQSSWQIWGPCYGHTFMDAVSTFQPTYADLVCWTWDLRTWKYRVNFSLML